MPVVSASSWLQVRLSVLQVSWSSSLLLLALLLLLLLLVVLQQGPLP